MPILVGFYVILTRPVLGISNTPDRNIMFVRDEWQCNNVVITLRMMDAL